MKNNLYTYLTDSKLINFMNDFFLYSCPITDNSLGHQRECVSSAVAVDAVAAPVTEGFQTCSMTTSTAYQTPVSE